jgi:dimeric dUTPase (all-alpha-NTP-PPase superfamily)
MGTNVIVDEIHDFVPSTEAKEEPTLIVEAPEIEPSLERQMNYWRDSALFAEKTISEIARSRSMQDKVRLFNQYVEKRKILDYNYVDVLQHLFQKKG